MEILWIISGFLLIGAVILLMEYLAFKQIQPKAEQIIISSLELHEKAEYKFLWERLKQRDVHMHYWVFMSVINNMVHSGKIKKTYSNTYPSVLRGPNALCLANASEQQFSHCE